MKYVSTEKKDDKTCTKITYLNITVKLIIESKYIPARFTPLALMI